MKLGIEGKLKNTRQQLIDWLVSNTSVVSEILNNTMGQVLKVDSLFREEALAQAEDEVTKLVQDEIARTIGLTPDQFYSTISKDEFSAYLKEVMNEGFTSDIIQSPV